MMKKIFLLLIPAAVLFVSCSKHDGGVADVAVSSSSAGTEDNPNGGGGSNTRSVPAPVTSAFNTRYPDATSIQWKLLSNGNYKAEFFRGSVKWQVIYTPAGALVKEEHV